jgi:hypothetical protein
LLHNYKKIDLKLARAEPKLQKGDKIASKMNEVDAAVYGLQKLAYEVDKTYEERSA